MGTVAEGLAIAVQHHRAGRLEQAEAIYRQILEVEPDQPDALHLLGLLAHHVGQSDLAVGYIRRAIQSRPQVADFHNTLGEVYRTQGRPEEALAHYRQALALRPDYAEAHTNLGSALRGQGKLDEAARCYQDALALKPGSAEAHNNLGVALQELGKLEEALAHYRQALALRPDYAEVYNNLGDLLRALGKPEEAVAHYRQALALKPTFAEAYYNLGNALNAWGKPEEAVAHYRQALALRPNLAEAHINLANALREQGKREEALAHYRQALALKPNFAEVENQVMQEMQHLCEWAGLEELIARQRAILRTMPSAKIPPFSVLAIPSTPAGQLLCAKNWVDNSFAPLMRLREGLGFDFPRRAKPKLRLGYLSADFRQHPVAYPVAELIDLHDRARFEVIAYSYGPDDGSAVRRRIAQGCDRFVDLAAASSVEAARRIHAEGADVLIDLMGYTRWARTEILALRPAPLQVNYLGYLGTMGADFIDYIITDRFVTPPEQVPFFTEKFVYLPDCFMINHRQHEWAQRCPARAECGLPESGFVFCCFNNTYKITPAIFDVWMRLLRATPGSALWLVEAHTSAAANLRREAQNRGVNPDRLVFAPRVPLETYLAHLSLADLFLDTLPYNAGATGSDALWAGLPVLTCAGETFISRVAGSLLRAIGLPELITDTLPDYEALALRLARNPSELTVLRKRLAANRLSAPLFDSERFTRRLETAYEMMWDIHLKGDPPRRIEVPAVADHTGL